MLSNVSKTVVGLILLMSVTAIGIGGFFIQQGFAKANYLTESMVSENITYGGAGGTITGIIDTPQEAQTMANLLEEHGKALGNYAQMKKDDPNRQTVLNSMTMRNSLELAVMGFGLTDVVKASGAFMVLMGVTFGLISVTSLRQR